MKIYSINKNGDFKFKREINIDDYLYNSSKSSQGIEIKHKKNGRKLFLATKELFDFCMYEYEKVKTNFIGRTFIYIQDEHRNKKRDENGKLLKKYVSQEDAEEYLKYALSCNYIQFKDFTKLYNRKILER